MGRLSCSIVLLVFLLHGSLLSGQSRYHFSTLGMDQGLSNNHVWSICQDKYGFMWIGTANGLNRYDGHSIRQYFNDPKDSLSIPGNIVYWIHKDSYGDMWFACGTQGVAKYNYAKDQFEKFVPYEKLRISKSLPAPVWRVGEDQRKRIYIACGGACFRYNKTTGEIEDLTPLFKGQIDNYGVAMFISQGNDTLWILTDNGLFLHDLQANTVEHIAYDKDKYGFGSAAMIDATFINQEEMIITTPRSAFVFFNVRTRQFRPAPPPLNPAVSKIYSICGGIVSDSRGRVWAANSVYGLIEYLKDGTTVSVKNVPSYPYPYPEQEGQGTNVYEDNDGNIWYGSSQQGIIWFQPKLDFIKVYQRDYANSASLGDNRVYGFYPSTDGNLFVGTGKTLSKLSVNTGTFLNFPRSVNTSGIYPAGAVRSFTTLHDTLVMATDLGLSFYDQKTGSFYRYTARDEDNPDPYELFTNYLGLVYPAQPGTLLLISTYGEAARFNIKSRRCFSKANPDTADVWYQYTGINCAIPDSSRKKIWVEVRAGELFEYDPITRKDTRHYFSYDSTVTTISAMALDPKGRLWIGTNKGLILYDPGSKQKQLINLPTATQHISNVGISGETLWATTSNEIVKMRLNDLMTISFNLDLLMSHVSIYRRSLFIDKSGNAWIGSNRGFCMVAPQIFRSETAMAAPHLVSFRVFDQRKVFEQPYYDLSYVELNYNENFFSFDFSSLDFNQAAGIKYAYKLEPFDPDWKLSDKNSASYTNVPPGTYQLLLRTQYGFGKWKEAAPVTIHIRAPYWQRWWFVSLVIAGMVLVLYLVYRFWQKRKQQKQVDETIDYFANSLYGENTISEICWDITRNCIAKMKFEDCVVYLLDEKRNVLVQKAAHGPKSPRDHEIINPIEIPLGKGIVGEAAATAKPILVKDTSEDKRYIVDDEKRMSELAIPIIHEGKAIGVIDSEHSKKNFFTEEHLKLLSTIAAISANKIAEAKADAAAKESKIQLLEIKKLLAESQLMALRAQMNPHFVFNCLNSIQECIVTQKYGEASLYLNKFSKLFRSVLNNSGKVMVTLAEEIEVLDLYLTLEHMRFEKSFTYTIDKDEELETDEILIPSMLLQPYVENALWHGLMHKQGDRRLSVSFTRKNNAVFECVIEDNGVGRKKAFELKEQQHKSKRHVSRGMTISQDRVELIRKQGQHAMLEIIDKYDEDGNASGTKIVIELSSFLQ
jgi:ligand-binding sensor domain-containing protein/putative methionine-R-sulfoxide reductase with GAF domain